MCVADSRMKYGTNNKPQGTVPRKVSRDSCKDCPICQERQRRPLATYIRSKSRQDRKKDVLEEEEHEESEEQQEKTEETKWDISASSYFSWIQEGSILTGVAILNTVCHNRFKKTKDFSTSHGVVNLIKVSQTYSKRILGGSTISIVGPPRNVIKSYQIFLKTTWERTMINNFIYSCFLKWHNTLESRVTALLAYIERGW